jgi:carboxyl-terminal processing protease
MFIKNSGKQILLPLLLVGVLIGGIYLGRVLTLGSGGNSSGRLLIYPQTNKIDALINLIEDQYVDTINKSELVESLIPEILKNLDPHSVYIPAKELEEVNQELDGNFGGIGVQFSIQDDTIMVVSVVSGGPSEKVGIVAGDRIVSVNDSVVAGVKVNTDDVMKRLRGPMGTKVTVGILRRNLSKPLQFVIERGAIPVYSVDVSFMITDQIGYIKVSRFGRNTFQEFITALAKLKTMNQCNKVIVDLRGNSGGYLDVAINMINEFLKQKELIVYTEGKASPRQNVFANGTGSCQNTEIAVLIDEFSASASEIFAGAIQDNDRGMVIGRRSFGKGLVQQQLPLPDGSAIRLTVARYYIPSGRSIQKPYINGVEDYYHDIMKRYTHGEFFQKDSIQFADSLVYTTKKGRKVYGGGGVMPDIFVPRDTLGFTPYYYQLRERGIIYQYALQYADSHRQELLKLTKAHEFVSWLEKQNVAAGMLKYAAQQGVKFNATQYATSERFILSELMGYIARNIIDNEGYFPIVLQNDEVVNVALKELQKNEK